MQSRVAGPFWLFTYGITSFISAVINDKEDHDNILVETDANARALSYFVRYNKDFMTLDPTTGKYSYKWDFVENPIIGYDRDQSIYDECNKKALFGNKFLKYLIISISKKGNAGEEDVIFKKIIAL